MFRDEVVWNVGNPMNNADTYTVRVCSDLGLDCDWFDTIRAHVQQQLDEVKQVRGLGQHVATGRSYTGGQWLLQL